MSSNGSNHESWKRILFTLTFILSLIKFLDSTGKAINRKAVVCTFAVPQKSSFAHQTASALHLGQFAYNTAKVHKCQVEVSMRHLQYVSSTAVRVWAKSNSNLCPPTQENRQVRHLAKHRLKKATYNPKNSTHS